MSIYYKMIKYCDYKLIQIGNNKKKIPKTSAWTVFFIWIQE